MDIMNKKTEFSTTILIYALSSHLAYAAISLDRTRVIYDGSKKSMSITISNNNEHLPYLAQAWIENEQGSKITSPLTVLPPVQRVEPGTKSQLKIQSVSGKESLPQDRESLFYFNLREIPPRSDKPNTLQIALQTRIKLFYRPEALIMTANEGLVWQEKITLTRSGNIYTVNNPTPFFLTLIEGSKSLKSEPEKDFVPLMVAPKGQGILKAGVSSLGDNPVLTYIDDYGGQLKIKFICNANRCLATIAESNG